MKCPVVVELLELELEPEVELELELQLLDCQRCCSGTLVKCPASSRADTRGAPDPAVGL